MGGGSIENAREWHSEDEKENSISTFLFEDTTYTLEWIGYECIRAQSVNEQQTIKTDK